MTKKQRDSLYKRIKHHWCPTWRFNFYYCIGWSEKDFKAYVEDSFNHTPNVKMANGTCLEVWNNDHHIFVIWVRKKSDLGSYLHECVHAAGMALTQRGWKYNAENDEPFAYLVQSIFEAGRS